MDTKKPPKCQSKKKRFATEQEAIDALTSAKIQLHLHGQKNRREIRAYACTLCLGWHLTSQPDERRRRLADARAIGKGHAQLRRLVDADATKEAR